MTVVSEKRQCWSGEELCSADDFKDLQDFMRQKKLKFFRAGEGCWNIPSVMWSRNESWDQEDSPVGKN